ncbi:MAG: DNA polymerase III subunit gamma/tau [Ghiorsea sp.]
MSYLVLARKWRPQRFADLTGQDVIVRTLKNALSSNHLAHAYLMTGIRGVGKTTISRLMAMAVNCIHAKEGEPCGECESCTSIAQGSNLDVQEMDAASHTGVDDIREILDGVRYPPVHLKIKVYIIDEAHMLSKNAFNALLKTLEEPPENVLFILATTESDKLPITVRSRCQRFDLRRLNVDEISAYLAFVLNKENIQTSEDALQIIARAADGSVRDALSLTERVLAFSNQNITISDVQQSLGLIGSEQTQLLTNAILSGNAIESVETLRQARELGVSPTHLLKSLSEQLHEMMCCKLDASLVPQGVSSATQTWLLAQADCWSTQALDIRYQALIHGLRDISLMDEQRGAEMIVMRLSHLNTISPPDHMIDQKLLLPTQKKTPEKGLTASAAPSINSETSQNLTPSEPEAEVSQEISPDPTTEATVEENIEEESPSKSEDEQDIVAAEEPEPINSWENAMNAYHKVKPGVAALLEHVICESFDEDVRLLLNQHQLESINEQERKAFEAWLERDVSWLKRTNEGGESLLDKKQREADEATRKLWQQAESNPNVQALKQALDCRLMDVKPPTVHFNDDDVENLEDDEKDEQAS